MNLPESPSSAPSPVSPTEHPVSATRIFVRGLAIAIPPILTLVILVWIAQAINNFIVLPISSAVRFSIAHAVQKIQPVDGLLRPDGLPALPFCEKGYLVPEDQRTVLLERLARVEDASREQAILDMRQELQKVAYFPRGKEAVPYLDYYDVAKERGVAQVPGTAIGIYMELVTIRSFQPLFHFSLVAVVISIVGVYSIGRFVTHRLGAWIVARAGWFVSGVPLVGQIFSAVKHVTDFFLAERDLKYQRVVAVEYPRPGIWSLGFVTGRGMPECAQAAGEPLVSVLIPSSPLPLTGYTMNVRKSELVDLSMTLDQAFQYVMSCGVLVPPPPPNSNSATLVGNGTAEPPALPGQTTQPAF